MASPVDTSGVDFNTGFSGNENNLAAQLAEDTLSNIFKTMVEFNSRLEVLVRELSKLDFPTLEVVQKYLRNPDFVYRRSAFCNSSVFKYEYTSNLLGVILKIIHTILNYGVQ